MLAVFLAAAVKPFTDRTEEDNALLGPWMDRLAWYETFRRAGIEPTFGPAAKRMRT